MSSDQLFIFFRAPSVLNGIPAHEDASMSKVAFFCSTADPTDMRRINSAGTAYVAFGGVAPVTGWQDTFTWNDSNIWADAA